MATHEFVGRRTSAPSSANDVRAFHNAVEIRGIPLVKASRTPDGVPADMSPSDIPDSLNVAAVDTSRMRLLQLDSAALPFEVSRLVEEGRLSRDVVMAPLRAVDGTSGEAVTDVVTASAMFVHEAFSSGDPEGHPDHVAAAFMAASSGADGIDGVVLGGVTYLSPSAAAAHLVPRPEDAPSGPPMEPLPPRMLRELAMLSSGHAVDLSDDTVAWAARNARPDFGGTIVLYGSRTMDMAVDDAVWAIQEMRFRRDLGLDPMSAVPGSSVPHPERLATIARAMVWSADPTSAARRAAGTGPSREETAGVTFRAVFRSGDVEFSMAAVAADGTSPFPPMMEGGRTDVVLAEGARPVSMTIHSLTMTPTAALLARGRMAEAAAPQPTRTNLDLSEFVNSYDRAKIQAAADSPSLRVRSDPEPVVDEAPRNRSAPAPTPTMASRSEMIAKAVSAAGLTSDERLADDRTRSGARRHRTVEVVEAVRSGNRTEMARMSVGRSDPADDARLGMEGLDRSEEKFYVPLEDVSGMSPSAKVFELRRLGTRSVPVRRGQTPDQAVDEALLRERPFRMDHRRLPEERRMGALLGTMSEGARALNAGDGLTSDLCRRELRGLLADIEERSSPDLGSRLEREHPGLASRIRLPRTPQAPQPMVEPSSAPTSTPSGPQRP